MRGKCDSCGFEPIELREYRDGVPGRIITAKLCAICSHTLAGTAHFWPSLYKENRAVLKTISFVGNLILKAMGKEADDEDLDFPEAANRPEEAL